MHTRLTRAFPFFLLAVAGQVSAADAGDAEAMPDSLRIRPVAPTNTLNGTRGLSQTPSAEALGAGRLVLGLSGPWYRQARAFPGTPNREADIFTGVGTAAYGLSSWADVFASLTGYSSLNYNSSDATGLGTVGGGAQITWPALEGFPLAMAIQGGMYAGLSRNPINRNQADGYNYFETRTGTDFRGTLIQSLVLGPERLGFKLHLNEGMAWSTRDVGGLLTLGAALQGNIGPMALGLELHSRTRADDVALLADPFWITPSVQLRTGWNVNITAGADFALSRDRDHSVAERSLEPWRLIGGIAFTLDTRWKRTRDAKWAALKAERAREREAKVHREFWAQAESTAQARAEATQAAEAERKARAALAACLAELRAPAIAKAPAEPPAPAPRRAPAPKRTPFEKRLLAGETIRLGAVPFASGKTELPASAKPYLDELARILVRYPSLRYELGGHADGSGNVEVNRILSQARAVAVKGYLSEREPDLENRIGVVGYGDSNPVADNAKGDGRRKNRRPDLKVANKAALAEYVDPAAPAQPTGTAMGPEDR